jgi:Family of unknown function (DUF5329)
MNRLPAIDGLAATALAAILAGWLAIYPCPAHAGMTAEIDHLLRHIETSDCTFTRNGNSHDGQAAGAHIRKKYAYAKGKITATEDFIRYAATKSSISGRPYQVTCDGVEMPTAQWLTQELSRFRGKTP